MSKFNVGDRVRVVAHDDYATRVRNGDEGVVEDALPRGYRVKGAWYDFSLFFHPHEIELASPFLPDRLTALESRVSALEKAAFVRALPPEPTVGEAVVRCLTEALDMLRPPTPKPASELRRGEVELGFRGSGWHADESHSNTWNHENVHPDWHFRRTDTTPPQEITKAQFVQALLNSEADEAQAPAVDTAGIKAKPLTLGDVEYKIPTRAWVSAIYIRHVKWLDSYPYTDDGWQFRNRHTKAPLTEAEFLDICRRERDKEPS